MNQLCIACDDCPLSGELCKKFPGCPSAGSVEDLTEYLARAAEEFYKLREGGNS